MSARIHYTISCPEPHTHHLHVEVKASVRGDGPVRFSLPVWTPGSYSVEDFAGRVHDASFRDDRGKPLRATKVDKCTWQVDPGSSRTVVASYKVFALDLDVHRSYLDSERCTINGAGVYMYVDGRKDEAVDVTFVPAPGWKRIDTGLDPAGRDGRTFTAPNYDDLVDCPVMMGNQRVEAFKVRGVPHRVVFTGPGNYDIPVLLRDMERIVEQGVAIFDDVPYAHYTFLMDIVGEGSGGLEHRNSTHMIFNRWGFQPRKDYILALGLISHEFFHTWNVKRMRPHPLGPFDYRNESYTDLLWLAEGFTSYYDLLLMVRGQCISPREFLEELGREIRRLWMAPGRSVMSLAESSFDTWIKLYKPTSDSANTTISYYNKGCLFALALDLEIRTRTKNARSLDDVMRLLYRRFFKQNDKGFVLEDVEEAAAEVAGRSLEPLFDHIVRGREEVDWGRWLRHAGLEIDSKQEPEPKLRHGDERGRSYLGLRLKTEGGTFVAQTIADGPAYAAELAPGDELIALDGLRLDEAKLDKWLGQLAPGKRVTFTTARRGVLRQVELTLGRRPLFDFAIQPRRTATALQKAICRDWTREAWDRLDRPERGFDWRPREKII